MMSVEVISQSRLFAILYISFCLPMRWLAAKTPELGQWGWGPISMAMQSILSERR